MDSPSHRHALLNERYRETGLGIARSGDVYYFTQLFLGKDER